LIAARGPLAAIKGVLLLRGGRRGRRRVREGRGWRGGEKERGKGEGKNWRSEEREDREGMCPLYVESWIRQWPRCMSGHNIRRGDGALALPRALVLSPAVSRINPWFANL